MAAACIYHQQWVLLLYLSQSASHTEPTAWRRLALSLSQSQSWFSSNPVSYLHCVFFFSCSSAPISAPSIISCAKISLHKRENFILFLKMVPCLCKMLFISCTGWQRFFSHSQSDHFNLNLLIAVTTIIIHHLLMMTLDEQKLSCCVEAQKEPQTENYIPHQAHSEFSKGVISVRVLLEYSIQVFRVPLVSKEGGLTQFLIIFFFHTNECLMLWRQTATTRTNVAGQFSTGGLETFVCVCQCRDASFFSVMFPSPRKGMERSKHRSTEEKTLLMSVHELNGSLASYSRHTELLKNVPGNVNTGCLGY